MSKNNELKVFATARIFARTNTDLMEPTFSPSEFEHIHKYLADFPENKVPTETLKQYRQELIEAIGGLYRITQYFGLVYDWSFHHVMMHRAHQLKEAPLDAYTVFRGHMESIYKAVEAVAPEGEKLNFTWGLIDEFVPMIPLRLTKEVYHDYIRKSFNILTNLHGEGVIGVKFSEWKNLNEMLAPNPAVLPACCIGFKQELDGFWNAEINTENADEIRIQAEGLEAFESKLRELIAAAFTLLDGVCAAIIMQEYGKESDFAEYRSWLGKDIQDQEEAIHKALEEVEASDKNGQDEYLNELFYESGLEYFNFPDLDFEISVEDALRLIDGCTNDLPTRKKRYIRQYCIRSMPFFDIKELEGYEQYFIKTYEALDDFNKLFMMVCVEYFDITVSERYRED